MGAIRGTNVPQQCPRHQFGRGPLLPLNQVAIDVLRDGNTRMAEDLGHHVEIGPLGLHQRRARVPELVDGDGPDPPASRSAGARGRRCPGPVGTYLAGKDEAVVLPRLTHRLPLGLAHAVSASKSTTDQGSSSRAPLAVAGVRRPRRQRVCVLQPLPDFPGPTASSPSSDALAERQGCPRPLRHSLSTKFPSWVQSHRGV